jgi:hypothetical protein
MSFPSFFFSLLSCNVVYSSFFSCTLVSCLYCTKTSLFSTLFGYKEVDQKNIICRVFLLLLLFFFFLISKKLGKNRVQPLLDEVFEFQGFIYNEIVQTLSLDFTSFPVIITQTDQLFIRTLWGFSIFLLFLKNVSQVLTGKQGGLS